MLNPPCQKCGNPEVVRLSTYQVVFCPDCNSETPWPLKEHQKPLINSSRGDKKQ